MALDSSLGDLGVTIRADLSALDGDFRRAEEKAQAAAARMSRTLTVGSGPDTAGFASWRRMEAQRGAIQLEPKTWNIGIEPSRIPVLARKIDVAQPQQETAVAAATTGGLSFEKLAMRLISAHIAAGLLTRGFETATAMMRLFATKLDDLKGFDQAFDKMIAGIPVLGGALAAATTTYEEMPTAKQAQALNLEGASWLTRGVRALYVPSAQMLGAAGYPFGEGQKKQEAAELESEIKRVAAAYEKGAGLRSQGAALELQARRGIELATTEDMNRELAQTRQAAEDREAKINANTAARYANAKTILKGQALTEAGQLYTGEQSYGIFQSRTQQATEEAAIRKRYAKKEREEQFKADAERAQRLQGLNEWANAKREADAEAWVKRQEASEERQKQAGAKIAIARAQASGDELQAELLGVQERYRKELEIAKAMQDDKLVAALTAEEKAEEAAIRSQEGRRRRMVNQHFAQIEPGQFTYGGNPRNVVQVQLNPEAQSRLNTIARQTGRVGRLR
jgi:hypothetical protein